MNKTKINHIIDWTFIVLCIVSILYFLVIKEYDQIPVFTWLLIWGIIANKRLNEIESLKETNRALSTQLGERFDIEMVKYFTKRKDKL